MRLLLLPLLISTSAFVHADDDLNQASSSSLIFRNTPSTSAAVIIPCGGCRVSHGADAFVTAEFLYWEAHQSGLEFARTGIAQSSSGSSLLPQGNLFTPKFQYDPGFRVGLGVGPGHDGWDLFVQYTWYEQNSQKNYITHSNSGVALLQNTPNIDFTIGSSSLSSSWGSWNLHLNVLDLELGRTSFFSKYLEINYFAGLKAFWQNQEFKTAYFWSTSQSDITEKLKTFAIGLRAGNKLRFFFSKNWSIFGNFALAVASSSPHLSTKATQNGLFNQHIGEKTSFIQPIFEMTMGFAWDAWFEDDAYHFGLKAGWEEEAWLNNNQLLTLSNTSLGGNLFMQGFTIQARLDF